MNREAGVGEVLMADQAYDRLIGVLRDGTLAAGQFVSMPGVVELIELPLAAAREAVKRADVDGLVRVLPKRGVLVMDASPKVTRDCMDLRAMLDAEGARRLPRETHSRHNLGFLRQVHAGSQRGPTWRLGHRNRRVDPGLVRQQRTLGHPAVVHEAGSGLERLRWLQQSGPRPSRPAGAHRDIAGAGCDSMASCKCPDHERRGDCTRRDPDVDCVPLRECPELRLTLPLPQL